MRALVFSDSHGNVASLDKVIEHFPRFEYIYGLGDYGISSVDLLVRNVTGVKGNMWSDPADYDNDLIVEKEGFRILFTHGHTYSVRGSLGSLYSYCKDKEVDVCFYGHTHEAKISSLNNIWFINPGSCGLPSIPAYPTVAIINVKYKIMNIEIIDAETFDTYESIRISI